MENQIRYSADIYSTYLADYRLEDVIIQEKDQFYRQAENQVQILDNSGLVLYDSIASPEIGKQLTTPDVEKAKDGTDGSYVGQPLHTDHRVMSITRPLFSRGEQVGIIRLTTSLEEVEYLIFHRYVTFFAFGFTAIIITGLISVLMANSVVKPINELIDVAEKLSDGQLSVRAKENNYDEIGKLGHTLNLMTDNIKEKEQLKNDFISSVSHELRTPLTSINGWAQTLEYDPEDTQMVKEGLKIIEGECTRLSDMVEELLDFSRFTSGRITMERNQIDITQIVIDIVKQLTPRGKSSGIDLVANYDPEHIIILADESRMRQVLINLVDNGIKFTNKGGTVMVNLEKKEEHILIDVIDTGIGIPKEEIDNVTDKFYKGSSSRSHTGLGLSICEEIIKLHNGKMKITSKVDEGTKVTVMIPVGEIDEV